MADWEVGMHSGCAMCMGRPKLISSTMVSLRHESDFALSIGVENDAIEEENALSHLAGIVS